MIRNRCFCSHATCDHPFGDKDAAAAADAHRQSVQ